MVANLPCLGGVSGSLGGILGDLQFLGGILRVLGGALGEILGEVLDYLLGGFLGGWPSSRGCRCDGPVAQSSSHNSSSLWVTFSSFGFLGLRLRKESGTFIFLER